jgi:16S rRNA (cytosine967-C5)-methyltransferase
MPEAMRVWDCCAAPGGKTLILAHRLGEAAIHATDVSPRRTAQMQARLKRFAYADGVVCAVVDAAAVPKDELSFDLILCDVPCSGTGTMATNPEIRHRLSPEDLSRQAARQREILAGALRRLAPGGRLVYSTCSLEAEENEQVIAAVLAEGVEFEVRRIPVDGPIQSLLAVGVVRTDAALASAVRDGALRTLPGVHPCDGFFAAILERIPGTR